MVWRSRSSAGLIAHAYDGGAKMSQRCSTLGSVGMKIWVALESAAPANNAISGRDGLEATARDAATSKWHHIVESVSWNPGVLLQYFQDTGTVQWDSSRLLIHRLAAQIRDRGSREKPLDRIPGRSYGRFGVQRSRR